MKKFVLFLGVFGLMACSPAASQEDNSSLLDELTRTPDSGSVVDSESANALEENEESRYEYSPTISPEIQE
jgi:hypothetical protein